MEAIISFIEYSHRARTVVMSQGLGDGVRGRELLGPGMKPWTQWNVVVELQCGHELQDMMGHSCRAIGNRCGGHGALDTERA